MIDFFMPMKTPSTTFQAKKITVRNGKAVLYDSAEAKKVRALLMAHLAKHAPASPLKGPVAFRVMWRYPIIGKHYEGELKTNKPDIDNLQKLLMDCMTKLKFWNDDSQVVILGAMKLWSDVPGILIKVEEL